MRRFAKSRKMAILLEAVEKALGYPVRALPLNRESSGLYEVASNINSDGYWELRVLPGATVNENILCHELMHMVLSLEGWPIHLMHERISSNSWERLVITQIFHNLAHSLIWPRVSALGYLNEEEKEFLNLLHPSYLKNLYSHYPQAGRSRLISNILQSVLLFPMNETAKTQILEKASRECPAAMALAEKADKAMSRFLPLTPQSYVMALETNLSVLSMPRDSLRHVFPNKVHSGFFERLCQVLDQISFRQE